MSKSLAATSMLGPTYLKLLAPKNQCKHDIVYIYMYMYDYVHIYIYVDWTLLHFSPYQNPSYRHLIYVQEQRIPHQRTHLLYLHQTVPILPSLYDVGLQKKPCREFVFWTEALEYWAYARSGYSRFCEISGMMSPVHDARC